MAFARDSYTASASQTDFTISFSYISESHIEVYKDGVLMGNDSDADTTSYQIVAGTTVRFGAGLTGGETVLVTRSTSQSTRLVDYASASTLTEEDLDNDSLQAFYMAQEAIDAVTTALGLGTNDHWDAVGKQINEVADPTAAQDAATKEYVDEFLVASGNVPVAAEAEDGDHLTVTTEGTIAWTNVEIATAEIEALAIDETLIAAEAVTAAKIEAGAVDEAALANAGVSLAKIDHTAGTEGQVLTNEEATSVVWGAAPSALVETQTFTDPATATEYLKPAGASIYNVQMWGAGGSGGQHNNSEGCCGGGGGGAYVSLWLADADVAADVEIAVGEGGAKVEGVNQGGLEGGATSFGTYIAGGGGGGASTNTGTAYGGNGGGAQATGAEGGTSVSESPQTGGIGGGGSDIAETNGGAWGGGGGGGGAAAASNSARGGSSIMGGGGGGGISNGGGGTSVGGSSTGGGDGGDGGATDGVDGTAPGGGGGASGATAGESGAGADGQIIVHAYS